MTNFDMIRQTALVILLIGFVSAKALPVLTGANGRFCKIRFLLLYTDHIPDALKVFATSLTSDDIQPLQKDSNITLEEIESTTEDLATRDDKILAKINQLSEIPRNFVINARTKFEKCNQTDLHGNFVTLYEFLLTEHQLPQEAKKEIFKAFPDVQSLFESATVKEWIKLFKNKTPQEFANVLTTQMKEPMTQ
ncbi:hypothetical protein L596_023311 [Steinernema carpocapsae]|uniref:Uncharacterized protein n=1 Tax=Steinernema carpocapsae TaxID=34508 RepID=A0A4U5MD94_STECR|nr:hypothetical protein L596_023311 [Steinernema carpocapsae]